MTDQPAAPFDVDDARKYANGPGAFMLLAACDRISQLEDEAEDADHWRRRAEPAEARVKELCADLERMDENACREREGRQKAEAANAALVEAIRKWDKSSAARFLTYTDRMATTMVEAQFNVACQELRDALASPSPGAKLLEELATQKGIAQRVLADERRILQERDRLAARNEKIRSVFDAIKGHWTYRGDDRFYHISGDAWLALENAIRACERETKP